MENKYVLVPSEPTREMLLAVCMHPDLARSLWSSMIKCAPVEQPPAVGGEPEYPKMDSLADLEYAQNTPDDWDEGYLKTWQDLQVQTRNKVQLRQYAKAMQVYVAPLLAESARLEQELDYRADWDQKQLAVIHQLNDRIAELEAAQGDENYKLAEKVRTALDRHASPLAWMNLAYEAVIDNYRQAQPATAKLVLPDRKDLPDLMMAGWHESKGWNACLDEVARLNDSKVRGQ